MTPEYMFEEMTWNEINGALDYVFRYETTERHYKGSVKLNDWLYPRRDILPDKLAQISADMRKVKT